jgi:hypothetical protein
MKVVLFCRVFEHVPRGRDVRFRHHVRPAGGMDSPCLSFVLAGTEGLPHRTHRLRRQLGCRWLHALGANVTGYDLARTKPAESVRPGKSRRLGPLNLRGHSATFSDSRLR